MDLAGRVIAIALAFGVTVFVHEMGHYLAARLVRMKIHEFSIGFGRPLLFWFRRGDTQYSFRLWPFFSYVRIAGMEPGDDHPDGFYRKRRPAQALVLVSGCAMNFAQAVLIYVLVGALIGMPAVLPTIQEVLPGSPAAEAGLRAGDRILGLDGEMNLSVRQIQQRIQDRPGRPVTVEVERDGARLSITMTPRAEVVYDMRGLRLFETTVGRIGILFGTRLERAGIGRSIRVGFVQTYQIVRLQAAALVGMVARTVPADLVGPVGVVHAMYGEAKESWFQFFTTFAAITVAIGSLNLLPIPPLDGSRLVIVGLEALRRRPFDKQKEVWIHLIGFALLLALVAVLTLKDIIRIVGGG